MKEVVYIRKFFYLPRSYDTQKGKTTIDDLNNLLEAVGVSFKVSEYDNAKRLYVSVDEEKLKAVTKKTGGRPVKYDFDDLAAAISKMKAEGMTNKQIYTALGISKSLFYIKMKEYRNIIGHDNN